MINIIKKLIKNITSAHNSDSYYIIIRIQEKTTFFDIPRWHCDGFYFKNRNRIQHKFLTTIKGNTTLILDTTKKEKDYYNILENYKNKSILDVNDMEYRKYIADNIKGKKINMTNNQGIMFIAGDKDNCLIHSEPKIDKDRIFIAIIPSSTENIMLLKEKNLNIMK